MSFGSAALRPEATLAGPTARSVRHNSAGRGRRDCRCEPVCGIAHTDKGGPPAPSACSIKPNQMDAMSPQWDTHTASHAPARYAGRDTRKLAGLGCRARLVRRDSSTPSHQHCLPSQPDVSKLQRDFHLQIARCFSPGGPCRPAGPRPPPAAPARATAWPGTRRGSSPKKRLQGKWAANSRGYRLSHVLIEGTSGSSLRHQKRGQTPKLRTF